MRQTFESWIFRKKVLICVGSGGVGKTTTSAVIGLHQALLGLKVLVLTIDPAKRLANSLGIHALDDRAQQVDLGVLSSQEVKGELWAMMLDMKRAFDQVIQRASPDLKAERRILNNKFYHYFSTSLAGTQEYAAIERLYELYEAQEYDLIILDTPPTTHALDFLDAPQKIFQALNGSAVQWLLKPGYWNLFHLGMRYMLKILSYFTGKDFLEELHEFFLAFQPLWEGFKTRAEKVQGILNSSEVGFIIVTSPEFLTLTEAQFFYRRLSKEKLDVGAVIANRVHRDFVPKPVLDAPEDFLYQKFEALLGSCAAWKELDYGARRAWSKILLQNAKDFHILSHKDRDHLEDFKGHVPATLLEVPFFSKDIYTVQGLNQLRQALFEPEPLKKWEDPFFSVDNTMSFEV